MGFALRFAFDSLARSLLLHWPVPPQRKRKRCLSALKPLRRRRAQATTSDAASNTITQNHARATTQLILFLSVDAHACPHFSLRTVRTPHLLFAE